MTIYGLNTRRRTSEGGAFDRGGEQGSRIGSEGVDGGKSIKISGIWDPYDGPNWSKGMNKNEENGGGGYRAPCSGGKRISQKSI